MTQSMAQVVNIIVGLSTALIGYIIGRLWQRLVDWLPYRQARLFLRPVMTGELCVVASRFREPSFPDGMVGGGDAAALRELAIFFGKIGFKYYESVYVDERHLNRKNNLVLLGGLDTNQITKDAMEEIGSNLTIVDPGPGIKMEIHDLAPDASCTDGSLEGAPSVRKFRATEKRDYGIIIRARNPFEPSKALTVVAGAYGYGTWGGIDLMQQDDFLQRCQELDSLSRKATKMSITAYLRFAVTILKGKASSRQWAPFECVFRVKVYDDRPLAPEILVFRQLSRVRS
jgi:hypothetical protein